MKTVAIIPAFNEVTTLRQIVDQALVFVDWVVVVDDGSEKELAQKITLRPNVTVIRHRINLGKGAALKTGTLFAQRRGADIVVFLDADGQHDPQEIPDLVAPLKGNIADIVFGVRDFHKNMPLVARVGNLFLSKVLQFLFRIYVQDTQSGYRAFRMDIYPSIEWASSRYAVETEMIVNVGKHHLSYRQVPIKTIYHDRYKGTTIIDGIRIFLNMLSWRLL